MMNDEIEIPRCHYCNRLAPEFAYDEIAVCIDCAVTMSAGRTWGLYRSPTGEIYVAVSNEPGKYAGWELLETGDFATLWKKSLDMEGDE